MLFPLWPIANVHQYIYTYVCSVTHNHMVEKCQASTSLPLGDNSECFQHGLKT